MALSWKWMLPLLLLSGCAPKWSVDDAPKQRTGELSDTMALVSMCSVFTGEEGWLPEKWWEVFGDPQLSRFIEKALENYPSVDVAIGRLKRAVAESGIVGSDLYPDFRGNAVYDVTKFSHDSLLRNHTNVPAVIRQTDLGVRLNYTFDIWGQNRKRYEAAVDEVKAMEEELADVRLHVATALADQYFQLQANHLILGFYQELLGYRNQRLGLLRERFKIGLEDERGVLELAKEVKELEDQITALAESGKLYLHRMNTFMGMGPDRQLEVEFLPQTLGASFPLPKHLPLDWVAHRPDIRASKHRLAAAEKLIKVAKIDFYPNIDLTAFFGISAIDFGKLFRQSSMTGGGHPALHLPFYTGGEITSRYKKRIAEFESSVSDYNERVLNAAREVADSVASIMTIEERKGTQMARREDTENLKRIALQRYAGEMDNRLPLLMRLEEIAFEKSVEVELAKLGNLARVHLIEALGGRS